MHAGAIHLMPCPYPKAESVAAVIGFSALRHHSEHSASLGAFDRRSNWASDLSTVELNMIPTDLKEYNVLGQRR